MTSPRSLDGDRKMVSDSLRVLEQVAARTGTVVYLEPLNRYQDHMINTLADARRYIVENNLKHVQIIGDFYHMNIEEDNLAQALHDNRDLLGHVHIADNHRYQPGSGTLDFHALFERKRAARTVLTGMCYSVGSATRQGSSSPTRFIGQSAMTSRT